MSYNEDNYEDLPIPEQSAELASDEDLMKSLQGLIVCLDRGPILNEGFLVKGPIGTRKLLDLLNEVYRRLSIIAIMNNSNNAPIEHIKPTNKNGKDLNG